MAIFRVFTDKKYRNQGIASKLMSKLDLRAAELGCETMFLETLCVRYEALNFYTRKGNTRCI